MQLLEKSTYYEIHNIDASPVKHLQISTTEYLHASFLLWEYKRSYSKREYRELLAGYGWDKSSTEEKRALKLAENFSDFAYRPHALAQIPITTLLRLCSDKYKPIIEVLKQVEEDDLTCAYVLDLIKERQALLKKQKESELKTKASIWKRNCRGERYAQFPPIYEDDHQTGVLTQKLMEEYGLIPQDILRKAIADLYQKISEGEQQEAATQEVDDAPENTNEAVNNKYNESKFSANQSQTVEERWLELNERLQKDIETLDYISNQTGNLIIENCLSWEAAVPQDRKWNAIAHVVNRDEALLKYLSNYAYGNNPQWRKNWGAILASYYNFEQELEWVGTAVRNDALMAMEFKIPAIVEVKDGDFQGKQGKIIELHGDNTSPILVKFDNSQIYFHWIELEIVAEAATFASNDILLLSNRHGMLYPLHKNEESLISHLRLLSY